MFIMAGQTKKRWMNRDHETSKTSANPKKRKQILRSDEDKRSKKQSDHVALPRWRALKEKALRGDTDVALFLLDWWVPLMFIEIKSTLTKLWTIALDRHTHSEE